MNIVASKACSPNKWRWLCPDMGMAPWMINGATSVGNTHMVYSQLNFNHLDKNDSINIGIEYPDPFMNDYYEMNFA